MKRTICFLLALLMLFSVLPVPVFAEEQADAEPVSAYAPKEQLPETQDAAPVERDARRAPTCVEWEDTEDVSEEDWEDSFWVFDENLGYNKVNEYDLDAGAGPAMRQTRILPPDELRHERVNELLEWLNNKYFNEGQNTDCKEKKKGDSHGCSLCNTGTIVGTTWFKKHFNDDISKVNIKTSQFFSQGSSCIGFAWFAAWYIFRTDDKDTITRKEEDKIKVQLKSKKKSDIEEYRKKLDENAAYGDFINTGGHGAIYLGNNNEGVEVLDCNGTGNYHCLVKKHTITWDYCRKITITKVYSKKANTGKGTYCPHPADSEYWQNGYCKKCHAILQYKTRDVEKGIYQLNIDYTMREGPYKSTPTVGNRLKAGTKVEVLGAVTNGLASPNDWYKVKAGGVTGFIYWNKSNPYLTKVDVVGSFSAESMTAPKDYVEGGRDHISGNLKVTDCVITNIKAYFCTTTGTTAISGTTTASDVPNKASYSLYNSNLDKKLDFTKLKPGTYRYCIELTTSEKVKFNGTQTKTVKLYSGLFTVKEKPTASVKPPSVEPIRSEPDAIVYQITQNTTGAMLYYYYSKAASDNGGNWYKSDKKQVEITITGDDTIRAYSLYQNNKAYAKDVHVQMPKLDEPLFDYTFTGDGTVVTIAAATGAKIYYSIDGGAFVPYTGAITLTETHTVSAYAQKNGCLTSDIWEETVYVEVPDAPELTLQTDAEVPVDGLATVTWPLDSAAAYYLVSVYSGEDCFVREHAVYTNGYAYQFETAGTYQIRVKSVNVAGTSEQSEISVTVLPDHLVQFLNWDGSLYLEQPVHYGESATKPAVSPTRRGYTFNGWEGDLTNVREDRTIQATFEINTYTVRFLDVDGSLLGTQSIPYDQPIDSAAMEAKVHPENSGRAFSGWYIEYASVDSALDLEHVDSDMRVRAVTAWRNEALPISVSDLTVRASIDGNGVFNGYIIGGKISSSEAEDRSVKIVVTLQNEAEDGSYKMLAATVVQTTISAGSSNLLLDGTLTDGVYVPTDGKSRATRAEVTVLSIEDSDKTGGLLSSRAAVEIPESTVSSAYWSEWMDLAALNGNGYSETDAGVEAKTQYREQTNTKSTVTTSSATPPEGYFFEANHSDWGTWSGWSTTAVTAVPGVRDVETRQVLVTAGRTEYRYGTWYGSGKTWCCNCDSAAHKAYKEKYTAWSTTRVSAKAKKITCGYVYTSSHPHKYYAGQLNSGGYNSSSHKDFWYQYDIGDMTYFWEQSRWVAPVYRTEYRYRDYINSYTHYTWNYGTWSEWTDTVLTDPDLTDNSYCVETQTLYRYQSFNPSGIPVDVSGTTFETEGTLPIENPEGKLVTVLVYKARNSDPTASQLEYVGQTELDASGGYTLRFRTKEQPSPETGDFIVALAAEGSSSLINVDLIRYERPTYTVNFILDDGKLVSSVQVEEGADAPLPRAPEREGYLFTGWSGRSTNIQSDTVLTARFAAEKQTAVFVDYLNQTCELVTIRTGENLSCPEAPTAEGHRFLSWGDYTPSMTLTSGTVFAAEWVADTFNVTFFDASGNVYDMQTVAYGQAAELPSAPPVADEFEFLGWSEEACWWCVTEDTDVAPLIAYRVTTAAPVSEDSTYYTGLDQTLRLSAAEDAEIYYTLDGSLPDPMMPQEADPETMTGTFLYENELELTEDAIVYAVAVAPDQNDSEVVSFAFSKQEEYTWLEDYDYVEEVASCEVDVDASSTVAVSLSLTENPGLEGAMIYVDADPTVFALRRNADTEEPVIQVGDVCADNGSIVVGDYDAEYGWPISWDAAQASTDDGLMFNLFFDANEEIEAGTYEIAVRYPTERVHTVEEDNYNFGEHLTVNTHIHQYETTVVPASCTEQGYTEYTCACGDSYQDSIVDALGHDYVENVVAPTCVEAGYTEYVCSRCGNRYTENDIDALQHSWDAGVITTEPTEEAEGVMTFTCSRCGETKTQAIPKLIHEHHYNAVVTPPSCTEQGYTTHTCACGESFVDAYTPALGHQFGDWVTAQAPTCTEAGTMKRICTNCGASETKETAALDHSYKQVVTEPTCTEGGYTTFTCSRCSDSYQDQLTDALGHDFSDWIVSKPASCTVNGTEVRNCSRCDAQQSRSIAATGHRESAWITDRNATCTSSGTMHTECTTCGITLNTASIAAFGHTETDWIVDREPTCTGSGTKHIECAVCGITLRTSVIPRLEHAYYDVVVAPSCMEAGYTQHICSRCNDTYTDTYVSALGHDWNGPVYTWSADNSEVTAIRTCKRNESHSETETVKTTSEVKAPASCIQKGETTYTAVFSNTAFAKQVKTVANIEALSHDYQAVVTEPTCTEVGYTTYTCSRCGDSYVADEVAATGHTPGESVMENETAATCTETGGYDMVTTCAVCGTELMREHTDVPALGHDWDSGVIEPVPTCTADGIKTFTCQRCGETRTEAVSATGHTPGTASKENEVAATCTTTGSYDMVVRCTVCNAILSTEHTETPALGHDYQAVVTASTCIEGGYTTYTCSCCGDSYVADETPALGHTPGEPVKENDTAPTCEAAGGYDMVIYCTVCNAEISREHTDVPALGHDWNEPEYVWADDYSTVTATRTCKNDASHVETEKVNTTSEVTKEATYEAEGEIVYTATFENAAFQTQTKTVSTPKLEKPDDPKPNNPFEDVKEGAYYYDAVLWAVNADPQITAGTSTATFSPNNTCTRAQVVTFLWRAMGQPDPTKTDNPFKDVKSGAYYYKAVLWAVENGVTAGTSSTTFSPNQGCTRAQVVTFLWRTHGQPEPTSSSNPFKDVTGGYYYTAVLWAVENKITAGTSATTFSPNQTCTRGQIVTFLYRDLVG